MENSTQGKSKQQEDNSNFYNRRNSEQDREERIEENVNIGMCTVYTLSFFAIVALIVYVVFYAKHDSDIEIDL
ncbi:UNKNOWN [Stylonychia lemnae]|uniref:Transmembrane protein n=1 Tax=Stylonychia lemnae TaxID=5949 RepID=A0A078ADU4_STYLE|nr:UNKNOWN [Stylonychia lemnae]|eukprot:CDW80380.1 UNKNOWN [Stylonychia lemnae]